MYSDEPPIISDEHWKNANARLTLTVHRATHLLAKDFGGTSDPYVLVEIGNTRLRTRTIQRDIHPVWNKTFHM